MTAQARPLHLLHRGVIDLEDAGGVCARDAIGARVHPGAQDDDRLHAVGKGLPQHVIEVGEATEEEAQNTGRPALAKPEQRLSKVAKREQREQGAEERSAKWSSERVAEEALLGGGVALDGSQRRGGDGGAFCLERHLLPSGGAVPHPGHPAMMS